MSDELVVVGLAALLGAAIGSFLNVCILRLPSEQSIVRPPSRCPRCGQGIRWYDNIPILSWLVLRGRCRSCGNPISAQYPLVELANAALWGWMAYRYPYELEALRAALFMSLLLGIAMTDAREYIIPDEFSLGGLVIGLLLSLIRGVAGLKTAAIGAVVGFALFWVVATLGKAVFRKEAMGGGDIKMMAMVGAFTGWVGVLLTTFLGAIAGLLVFAPIALSGRQKLVPFGVFLAVGAAVAFLWGDALLLWYRHFAGIG
ncbi:MAG: A24 family peptidase [Gemmatimonadales bacterium]